MESAKTIYDIAKEAGVSASTVSRVVNNKPGINEKTRKKVQQLLEKYNYIPNEAARGLVTQSSRIIGILIEDIRVFHHTESAYVIEQEMTRLGYTCKHRTGSQKEGRIYSASGAEAGRGRYFDGLNVWQQRG